ncbi:hypothetical protein PIROE2DRAFT_14256 [Piromyces sp. E2]|nr:hypothetical protein PIROE2DRAFT_14256 [Piromyces sp. E2]|eukprot:OUM60064.1 hypothetical protein PIROE2DRAFT_14256 [Piromyces sp. E2]
MIKSPVNELIDEYLEKSKSILRRSLISEYKTENHIYHDKIDSTRFRKICLGDPDFLFQYKVITHCINGLDKFYNVLFESLFKTVRETTYNMIFLSIGGSLLVIISFLICYRSIISDHKILYEMVDIIFIIPKSTINMVPQLKRFIETASFEDE